MLLLLHVLDAEGVLVAVAKEGASGVLWSKQDWYSLSYKILYSGS